MVSAPARSPAGEIVPFRGEYLQIKKESQFLVKHLSYPVPTRSFVSAFHLPVAAGRH